MSTDIAVGFTKREVRMLKDCISAKIHYKKRESEQMIRDGYPEGAEENLAYIEKLIVLYIRLDRELREEIQP